jgi:hypothetical protein
MRTSPPQSPPWRNEKDFEKIEKGTREREREKTNVIKN